MMWRRLWYWLHGWQPGGPTWTQDDLASAWRKMQVEHVTGEPARLTPSEYLAWWEMWRARRRAYEERE